LKQASIMRVAADAGAVAERLVDRLAERDADVLDRVVGAGFEVPGGPHPEPQAAVPRKQVEHVVEEADAGLGARLAAVEVEGERDLRLVRLAIDLGAA
jgi:hypothetical protein